MLVSVKMTFLVLEEGRLPNTSKFSSMQLLELSEESINSSASVCVLALILSSYFVTAGYKILVTSARNHVIIF